MSNARRSSPIPVSIFLLRQWDEFSIRLPVELRKNMIPDFEIPVAVKIAFLPPIQNHGHIKFRSMARRVRWDPSSKNYCPRPNRTT